MKTKLTFIIILLLTFVMEIAVPLTASAAVRRTRYAQQHTVYVRRRSKGKQAAIIGGSAAGGALIGGLAGGGKGALIGGAIGAGGGALYNHHTRDKKVVR